MLLDLTDAVVVQHELEIDGAAPARDRARLMRAVDLVNDRWGVGTMKVGSTKIGITPTAWEMRQQRRTPAYTTDWASMPMVRS